MEKVKEQAYNELYARFDIKEGEKDLWHLWRQRDQARSDVQQVWGIEDIEDCKEKKGGGGGNCGTGSQKDLVKIKYYLGVVRLLKPYYPQK